MKLSRIFLSMALAAIVAFAINPTMLFAQAAAPCANGTTIAQNDSYNNGLALVWKHHYAATDEKNARSDEHYNGPALVWVDDYNAAYHRDAPPCLPLATGIQTPLVQKAPAHVTASLSLSREDREKFNALIDALRAQGGSVADGLNNLANSNGNIADILAAIQKDLQGGNHDDAMIAALGKTSDMLAGMLEESKNAQIQLVNALTGGFAEFNKTQTQILGVETQRRDLEKKLVFWTRWNALANTFAAAAEWSQFGLAAKTGGYGASASAAASASSVSLAAQKAAAMPTAVF